MLTPEIGCAAESIDQLINHAIVLVLEAGSA